MFSTNFAHPCSEGDAITCTVDGFDCTATVYRDDVNPGWVSPENFETEQKKARLAMAGWLKDEWWYVGIAVTVSKQGIQLTGKYNHARWGIECNHTFGDGNAYLREVANEQLLEALQDARAKLAKLCEPEPVITGGGPQRGDL